MSSVEEILARGRLLLNRPKLSVPLYNLVDFHAKYLEPPRTHKCFNVLAPVGEYKWSDEIVEWYPPYTSNKVPEKVDWVWRTVVIHGHPKGQVCQNRDLCHILGFQPVGNEHPWFLKEWEKFNYDK